jgi:hypothetical protein
MDYDKIPYVAARKAAEGLNWHAPSGLTADWLKDLSGGARPPLGEVIGMLAFGRTMSPDGLSDTDALAKLIIAAAGLFRATGDGKIEIFGVRAEVWPGLIGTVGLRGLAPLGRIDRAEFEDGKLTLSPINWGWLCLTDIASNPAAWTTERHIDAVRYYGVSIDATSLRKWIAELSRTKARYEKPKTELALAALNRRWPEKIPPGMPRGTIYGAINDEASKIVGRKIEIDRKVLKPIVDASGKI